MLEFFYVLLANSFIFRRLCKLVFVSGIVFQSLQVTTTNAIVIFDCTNTNLHFEPQSSKGGLRKYQLVWGSKKKGRFHRSGMNRNAVADVSEIFISLCAKF